MNGQIVRIQLVSLTNFKNVQNGVITLPGYMKSDYSNKKSEIVGLYGQNGSGKTALVDAMWMLKHVLSGDPLPDDTDDYIYQASQTSELSFIFDLELKGKKKYLVFYQITLGRTSENKVQILKESLSYKKFVDGEWKSKAGIIEYDMPNRSTLFRPINNFRLLTANNSDALVELGVAKRISEKGTNSFIFGSEMEEIIKKSDNFKEYTEIILTLKAYAKYNLIIIRNSHSGMINLNLLMPFSFRLNNEEGLIFGKIGIGILRPTVVPEKIYKQVTNVFKQMNIVLGTIIPGLKVDIKNHGKELMEDGREGIRIELISVRGDTTIPLKYESDGIKKIISILSSLIAMFNNPSICMVIDELDAGIFEYLLGELLQIISQSGKGQLIFTSHNLRPLEMLDPKFLVFTTTNSDNRYIRFSNIKDTNNLRGTYYRSISIGGQKENLYEETNNFEISRAFRLAGRVVDE